MKLVNCRQLVKSKHYEAAKSIEFIGLVAVTRVRSRFGPNRRDWYLHTGIYNPHEERVYALVSFNYTPDYAYAYTITDGLRFYHIAIRYEFEHIIGTKIPVFSVGRLENVWGYVDDRFLFGMHPSDVEKAVYAISEHIA